MNFIEQLKILAENRLTALNQAMANAIQSGNAEVIPSLEAEIEEAQAALNKLKE